jgi:hypothetical protein
LLQPLKTALEEYFVRLFILFYMFSVRLFILYVVQTYKTRNRIHLIYMDELDVDDHFVRLHIVFDAPMISFRIFLIY